MSSISKNSDVSSVQIAYSETDKNRRRLRDIVIKLQDIEKRLSIATDTNNVTKSGYIEEMLNRVSSSEASIATNIEDLKHTLASLLELEREPYDPNREIPAESVRSVEKMRDAIYYFEITLKGVESRISNIIDAIVKNASTFIIDHIEKNALIDETSKVVNEYSYIFKSIINNIRSEDNIVVREELYKQGISTMIYVYQYALHYADDGREGVRMYRTTHKTLDGGLPVSNKEFPVSVVPHVNFGAKTYRLDMVPSLHAIRLTNMHRYNSMSPEYSKLAEKMYGGGIYQISVASKATEFVARIFMKPRKDIRGKYNCGKIELIHSPTVVDGTKSKRIGTILRILPYAVESIFDNTNGPSNDLSIFVDVSAFGNSFEASFSNEDSLFIDIEPIHATIEGSMHPMMVSEATSSSDTLKRRASRYSTSGTEQEPYEDPYMFSYRNSDGNLNHELAKRPIMSLNDGSIYAGGPGLNYTKESVLNDTDLNVLEIGGNIKGNDVIGLKQDVVSNRPVKGDQIDGDSLSAVSTGNKMFARQVGLQSINVDIRDGMEFDNNIDNAQQISNRDVYSLTRGDTQTPSLETDIRANRVRMVVENTKLVGENERFINHAIPSYSYDNVKILNDRYIVEHDFPNKSYNDGLFGLPVIDDDNTTKYKDDIRSYPDIELGMREIVKEKFRLSFKHKLYFNDVFQHSFEDKTDADKLILETSILSAKLNGVEVTNLTDIINPIPELIINDDILPVGEEFVTKFYDIPLGNNVNWEDDSLEIILLAKVRTPNRVLYEKKFTIGKTVGIKISPSDITATVTYIGVANLYEIMLDFKEVLKDEDTTDTKFKMSVYKSVSTIENGAEINIYDEIDIGLGVMVFTLRSPIYGIEPPPTIDSTNDTDYKYRLVIKQYIDDKHIKDTSVNLYASKFKT